MRPRPDATENTAGCAQGLCASGCFNEAAARCHGKRPRPEKFFCADPASMRPRPDATENPFADEDLDFDGPGFNEAAARCHGKPLTHRP